MNYKEIKKLDEESLEQLQEGTGPIDECICSLISPPDEDRKSLGASIKRAFASFAPGKKRKNMGGGGGRGGGIGGGGRGGGIGGGGGIGAKGVDIPLVFSKGENGIYTEKEVVQRRSSCGKCGCDKDKVVLKHSYANIRITSPDVSSFCPCPNDCLSEKQKSLLNNIKVTVEHVAIDPDSENSETSLHQHRQKTVKEPDLSDKKSVTSLINAQYENEEENLYN